MTKNEAIQAAAIVENAKKYAAEQDQFIFCLDLLGGISANHPNADEWVNELEDEFDRLNNTAL